jgi:hypothetical protein
MRTSSLFVAVTFLISATATSAFAQRAPAAGMWAVGASIGASMPSDPSLDNGLEVAGNVENYLTPRVSIRGQVAGSSWNIVNRNFTGTVKPVRLDGNIVYNWEGGAWHPYVTGGVGVYHYRSTIPGAPKAGDTEAGINLGGGVEYFFERRTTLTGELLYHHAGAFNTSIATFNQGSYWSLDFGLKAYLRRR